MLRYILFHIVTECLWTKSRDWLKLKNWKAKFSLMKKMVHPKDPANFMAINKKIALIVSSDTSLLSLE